MGKSNLVRFDWAAKRLLRNKSNFVVLEGFLSVLLEDEIHIERILESEGNQQKFDDKFNRVDMLAENSKGELVIIEVQNNRELDYFHRMLYGTSKAITEYMNQGDPYAKVKKVYSVNIVYFDLGQGDDYVYHGYTEFRGIHTKDVLRLSVQQQEQFVCHDAGELFPEYYVLRVDEFDKLAKTPLDEWILFLKTGEIAENVTASGLREARERLRVDKLSDAAIAEKITSIFDLRPKAIEERLKLRNPIYQETASYGHMGRTPRIVKKVFSSNYWPTIEKEVELFTWEKLDYIEKIKEAFK